MEKSKEPRDYGSTVSQNNLEPDDSSLSENTLNAYSGNRVYIDAPKNVEVYLDGNFVGISPVSFKKVIGSHTITLRKSGYVTKSYTIYLYNDGEDITYSFSDLEKVSSSASGNSGNTSKNSSKNSSDTVSGNESSSNDSTSSKSTENDDDTEDKSESESGNDSEHYE